MPTSMFWKKFFKFIILKIIFEILGYLGIGSACLPILVSIYVKLHTKSERLYKFLLLLCILFFITNITTLLLFLFTRFNQNFLINIHSIIEFFLLVFFYKELMKKSQIHNWYNFIIFFNAIITICNFFFYNINENFTILNVFQKLCLITLSMYYLYKCYNSELYSRLTDSPFFFTNIAVLIFNASSLYISFFESFLRIENEHIFYILWPFLQICGITYYFFFSIGIWKLRD